MDFEPLVDAHAPRYAIESDSEDELDETSAATETTALYPQITATLHPNIPSTDKLWIASGNAGLQWISNVTPLNKLGPILIGTSEVGCVYSVDNSVAVAHVHCSISPATCYVLAAAILSAIKPRRVVLLDSYPASTYVSEHPSSSYDAPLRVLSTSQHASPLPGCLPFCPPNLVQLLPASVLSLLEIARIPGTAILLPSLHASPPPKGQPTALSSFESYSHETLAAAHKCGLIVLGTDTFRWKMVPDSGYARGSRQANGSRQGDEVGEGSMYI